MNLGRAQLVLLVSVPACLQTRPMGPGGGGLLGPRAERMTGAVERRLREQPASPPPLGPRAGSMRPSVGVLGQREVSRLS